MFWIFLLFLIFAAVGCYIAYKEAKVHELHKMRAAFEDRRHKVEELIKTEDPNEDKDVIDIFKGEIMGFDKAISALIEEGADKDAIDDIKKDIEVLKEKIYNLFH